MTRGIVTPKYKVFSAKTLMDHISKSDSFLFGSRFNPHDNDNMPSQQETSVDGLFYDVINQMLFAKKIPEANFSQVIRRYDWEPNKIYAQYDHTDPNLHDKQFYVVSKEGPTYSVFKCISNNRNALSTFKPLFSQASVFDDLFLLPDGYIWKYMYSVDEQTERKFGLKDWFPVVQDEDVKNNAKKGGIEVVKVDSPGKNYFNQVSGIIGLSNVEGNKRKFYIEAEEPLSTVIGFYVGNAMYMTSGTQHGGIRQIVEYGFEGPNRFIIIDSEFDDLPQVGDLFKIAPMVTFEGDGTGFVGVAEIDDVSRELKSVVVISSGEGYSRATPVISTNKSAEGFEEAVITPILPPQGGHGFNAFNELFATHFCVFVDMEGFSLPSQDITYRQLGILYSPVYQGVDLTMDSVEFIEVGDIISQGSVIGRVKEKIGNNIVLQDVEGGFFEEGEIESGETIISVNTFLNNLDLRTVINIDYIGSGTFIPGEEIFQTNTNASCILLSERNENIFISCTRGNFSTLQDDILIGRESNARALINSIDRPKISLDSGDILYVENISPIERTDFQTERVKLVFGAI